MAAVAARPEVRYRYRPAGTSEEVTDCDLCGKQGLKSTVILEYLDGEGNGEGQRYVGSDCAGVLLAYAEVKTEAELKLSRRELKDARAARAALRAAHAADLRRAGAVENSRRFFDHYQPFIGRQEDPQEREDRGCYIREYGRCNPVAHWDLGKVSHYDRAMEALARHRAVIATGGRSAL